MPRRPWTILEDVSIRDEYPTLGPIPLAERFGRSPGSVSGRASLLKVKVIDPHTKKAETHHKRRPNVNVTFFDEWNPLMSRVSGYTWADGSILESDAGTPNAIRYCCKTDDREVLIQTREVLDSRHHVLDRPAEIRNSGAERGPETYCVVCSSRLVKPLVQKQGMLPRKSELDLPLPDVPEEYLGDFCGGYFCGDGCASVGVEFLGSRLFIQGLRSRIVKSLGLRVPALAPNGSVWCISWKAVRDVGILCKWMFPATDDYPCLSRKRDSLRLISGV